MAQSAKTIQCQDIAQNNISPMVNIESLYYEITESNTVKRHFMYDSFPIYVNFNNKMETINQLSYQQGVGRYITLPNDRILTYQGEHIVISGIAVNKLDGTIYNKIDASNYDLSEILYNFESRSACDASIRELREYVDNKFDVLNPVIRNINSSIGDINTSIGAIQGIINNFADGTTYTYEGLQQEVQNQSLIPGKVYRMTYNYERRQDYYPFDLFLLADTSTSFSSDVVGATRTVGDTYFSDCNLNLWDIKYNFTDNDIFYMMDEYFNEAPFDFKHKRFQPQDPGPEYYWLSYYDTNDNNVIKDLSIVLGAKTYNNRLDATCDNNEPYIFLINSSNGQIMNTQVGENTWNVMFSGADIIGNIQLSNVQGVRVTYNSSSSPKKQECLHIDNCSNIHITGRAQQTTLRNCTDLSIGSCVQSDIVDSKNIYNVEFIKSQINNCSNVSSNNSSIRSIITSNFNTVSDITLKDATSHNTLNNTNSLVFNGAYGIMVSSSSGLTLSLSDTSCCYFGQKIYADSFIVQH